MSASAPTTSATMAIRRAWLAASSAAVNSACAVADGLFVPLHELEQRGVQPALAARALAEVRLLVHKDRNRPPTVSRDFAGAPTVGLVICPSCVEGFDPAAFTVAAPAEH